MIRKEASAAARAAAVLGQLYGEQAMVAHYQTKPDDVIRATDLPERLQLVLAGRPSPHPKELDMEATYILNRLFPKGVPKSGVRQPRMRETRNPGGGGPTFLFHFL